MSLTSKILLGMVLGLSLGLILQWLELTPDNLFRVYLVEGFFDALGQIFIVSLKMLVVPLVFVSLTCGAASLGATGSVGRLGGKAIGLYLFTTGVAVTMALSVALIIDPGMDAGSVLEAPDYQVSETPGIKETLINIFPDNPVASMADGEMLQIIVFAMLLGIALSQSKLAGQRVVSFFEDLNEILMRLITLIISLAPYGVFCLMLKLGLSVGWSEITKLASYFFTVVLVLAMQALVVYPLLLSVIARVSPVVYLKKMREPFLVAFSTASSGATMPVTLRTVKEKLGVDNKVASFAVPLGTTVNMDGTAIMQGVATVFIAQFYGIDLSVDAYLMVILTATMVSIGAAGVPGVGIVMLSMVLAQAGLPVEGIGLIIGVDRLLDMMRTCVNVAGDGMVSTSIAASEGQLDRDTFNNMELMRAKD
ncbi:dicarboxylate/amino acid:cation symporter [Gammaproteobacteria bacterium]|nr:dicarboxylate/amino acid:cation symporter [Gammaproteobacteria bacterium]